jgi:hypothetical protein
MSQGITFPQSPADGDTFSFTFTHTGGAAGNTPITRTWSWNESRNAWISNGGVGGGNGGNGIPGDQGDVGPTGPQGFQGFQGFQGSQGFQGITGSISNITVNGELYSNPQNLIFISDHSLTSSFDDQTLTITLGSFMGMITGNADKISGVARWIYDIKPASFNGSNWSLGGQSLTALNLLEFANVTNSAYGMGVLPPDGITLSRPGFTGFSVRPVPNGVPVEVIIKDNTLFFSAPNPIDGEC